MKNKNQRKKIGCMVVVLLIFCISHLAAEPCGDVNSDGSIDIVDALLIAQNYVGLDPANFDAAAADVNGNGPIDIVDALLIAQYYVGLITELPGCAGTPTPTPDPNAPVGPEGYIYCADEGDSITFDMYVNAAYGADSNFNYLYEVTGTITFDNDTFGDPIYGIVKHGFYQVAGTPTPTPEITPTPTPGPTADPSVPSGPFANQPVGFASLNGGTTGGAGGQTVTVTNQSDLESYAGSSDPYIIKVQGTITISPFGKEVNVASNKTIVGVGADATINEGGFIIFFQKNVIIRNLTIRDSYVTSDPAGETQDFDAIQVDTSQNIWLDHCHFTRAGDGLMDLRKDTDYVTVSWCIFSNHNKCWGVGWTDNVISKMTLHHNWIHDTERRNPSFDNAIGHLYNNFLENISAYGTWIRGNSIAVIENSYYKNVKDPWFVDSGELIVRGNIAVDCSGKQDGNKGSAFDPSSYYSYTHTLDPVDDVPDLLRAYAGPNANVQY